VSNMSDGAIAWHDDIAERFAGAYNRSPAFQDRLKIWSGLIETHVQPGDAVLDMGCGPGLFSMLAARRGAQVLGIDGSERMIALCRESAATSGVSNLAFDVADIAALDDRAARSLDVILCSSVLEYVPDLDRQLARFARLLRPGGTLIVSMPNAQSFYRRIERLAFLLARRPRYYAHVRNVPSTAAMTAALTRAGFSVEDTRFFAAPPFALPGVGPRHSATLFVMVARREG